MTLAGAQKSQLGGTHPAELARADSAPGDAGLDGMPSSVGVAADKAMGRPDSVLQCARPDLAAAGRAARDFLTALGVSVNSPGMTRSPERMAEAYAAMLTAPQFEPTMFPNDAGYDELVVVSSIPVQSVCEHHFLPFSGRARVGYLPGERIIGLSKMARVVEFFARRPQVQERLTQQIARWLDVQLSPRGVGVIIEAEHSCMTVRGVRALGSLTTTTALSGRLRDDQRSRAEFLTAVGA